MRSPPPQLVLPEIDRVVTEAPIVDRIVSLEGLEEHREAQIALAALSLDDRPIARGVFLHAYSEILNNAIDHSGSILARARVWRASNRIVVEIADDGDGVFAHMRMGLGLPDDFAAIQALTKGKHTTDPTRHPGEGIFFTTKAVEEFKLAANGLEWVVDNPRSDHAVGVSHIQVGTQVRWAIDPDTPRDLPSLFRSYTIDHEFARSRPVVKLFGLGLAFVSRSDC